MKSAAVLAALLAVVNAHGNTWVTDTCFPRPGNTDNHCSKHQRDGFDFGDLGDGPFSSYGGLGFSGFSCGSDNGRKRTFGSGKCISGKLGGDGSGPSISCGEDKSGFSISHFHISTDKHTEVDCHFGMPDGSTCKYTTSCGPEGTEATNDQCGGATSVSFHHKGHGDCGVSIHSIGFHCGHPSTTVPVSPPTGVPSSSGVSPISSSAPAPPPASSGPAAPPSSSAPAPPPVSSAPVPPASSGPAAPSSSAPAPPPASTGPAVPPASSGPAAPSSSAPAPPPASTGPAVPPSSSVPAPPPVSSAPVVPTSSAPVQMTTSTVYTTTEVTITSCAPTVTNCPAHSTTVVTKTIAISTTICPVTATETPSSVAPVQSSAPPAVTTVVTYETTTICPVTATMTSGGSEIVTTYTTTSTITTSSVSTIAPGPTGVPSSPCPNSVPKCINTWLTLMPHCDSNSDASCFCPSSEFTDKVIACITAWGATDEEIQTALSYFTGICGAYVPQNPGIVTAIPSTITLAPTGASTTITYSTYTVTVPEVAFTTSGPSQSVGLIPAVGAVTAAPSKPVIPSGFSTAFTAPPTGSATPSSPGFNNGASGLAASSGLLVTVVAAVFGLLL